VNIPSNIITLIAGIAITLISLWYGQHHGLLPIAASEEAAEVDDIFNFMMTIATGLFLLIEGVLVVCLFQFRRKKGDETDGPHIEGNIPLEIVWTAIPTVIVFMIAIYSFEIYNQMGGLDPMAAGDRGTEIAHHHGVRHAPSQQIALDPDGQNLALGLGSSPSKSGAEPPLVVNVNGIQYAWIFTYPETGIIGGDMHIPVNREVQLNITAGDVLHAFWLPEFRIKQDAIPGRTTELVFTANRVGTYPIICAELCGSFHGGMKTQLYVQTEAEYAQWLQENSPAPAESTENSVAMTPTQPQSDREFLTSNADAMEIPAQLPEPLNGGLKEKDEG